MNETIELCRKLKELKWIGWECPELTKDDSNGYAWACHNRGTILEEWLPNPGRKALMAEIENLMGTEEFEKRILKNVKREIAHQIFSHEDWMRVWIKLQQK